MATDMAEATARRRSDVPRRSRGHHPLRRTRRDWAARIILALVVAVIGYAAVTRSMAQVLRTTAPDAAHRLAPEDGRVTARLAASVVDLQAPASGRSLAERLARAALLSDPLAVQAAATLGIEAQRRGDVSRARRLFGYAERVSRREVQTQLWAIEDAVARGDISGALRHYDIALRTTPSTSEVLYPVLGSAIAEPAVLNALAAVLRKGPLWRDDFTSYLATNGADPRATARMFAALDRSGAGVDPEAQAGLVNSLVARGDGAGAWTYYASIRRGVDRRRSRDPHFSAGLAHPSSFDWTQNNDADLGTSIQRGERGGVVDFAVPAGRGGPLLQQVQWLPPGRYRLDGHSAGISQRPGALPYWSLSCLKGLEVGRVDVPNSNENGGVFSGTFTVPAGCPLQALVLNVRPSDAAAGVSGQIDRAALTPLGGGEE